MPVTAGFGKPDRFTEVSSMTAEVLPTPYVMQPEEK